MALFEQVGNYVKIRVTPLPETANNEDFERIHISEFGVSSIATRTISFQDGSRTVLVINGEAEAQAFYADTMANLIADVDDFIETLEEAGGSSGAGTLQSVTTAGNTTNKTIRVQDPDDPEIETIISGGAIGLIDGSAFPYVQLSNNGIDSGDGTRFNHTIHVDGSVTKNGSTFYEKLIVIPKEQVRTGKTTPILLAAALGPGTYVYAMHDTVASCINGVVPAIATVMSIYSFGSVRSHITWGGGGGFMDSATTNPIKGDDSVGVDRADCILENANLMVKFNEDNPDFDGEVRILLMYKTFGL